MRGRICLSGVLVSRQHSDSGLTRCPLRFRRSTCVLSKFHAEMRFHIREISRDELETEDKDAITLTSESKCDQAVHTDTELECYLDAEHDPLVDLGSSQTAGDATAEPAKPEDEDGALLALPKLGDNDEGSLDGDSSLDSSSSSDGDSSGSCDEGECDSDDLVRQFGEPSSSSPTTPVVNEDEYDAEISRITKLADMGSVGPILGVADAAIRERRGLRLRPAPHELEFKMRDRSSLPSPPPSSASAPGAIVQFSLPLESAIKPQASDEDTKRAMLLQLELYKRKGHAAAASHSSGSSSAHAQTLRAESQLPFVKKANYEEITMPTPPPDEDQYEDMLDEELPMDTLFTSVDGCETLIWQASAHNTFKLTQRLWGDMLRYVDLKNIRAGAVVSQHIWLVTSLMEADRPLAAGDIVGTFLTVLTSEPGRSWLMHNSVPFHPLSASCAQYFLTMMTRRCVRSFCHGQDCQRRCQVQH